MESSALSIPPNFKASRNYRNITKWSETVTEHKTNSLPLMMQHAFALLRSGKMAPILLEFPSDVLLADFPGDFAYQPQRRYCPRPAMSGMFATRSRRSFPRRRP